MENNNEKKLTEEEKKLLADKQKKQEEEAVELIQRSSQTTGKQLEFDVNTNEIKEVDELRDLLGRQFEDPDQKYQAYYMGIRKVLMQYLPKGPDFKMARDLIYDEKNVFLNRGKKKSDNNGIRKSDGRMTFQPVMNEIVDLIIKWVAESQHPVRLYNMLYELNEKHGYGHEQYDGTALSFANAMAKLKEEE